ncbi:hypothetical protein [Promicromonospora soli]
MTTTDDARKRPAQPTTGRRGLRCRLLVAVAAIVAYTAVALALAALVPEGWWPAIGNDEYSPGQAAVVPALNLFAVGAIVLALLHPALPATARMALDVLLGVGAAGAGPALAVVSGEGTATGLVAPGVLALAVVGIIVGVARTRVTRRAPNPDPQPAPDPTARDGDGEMEPK